jgi:hypothetical protein
MLHLLVRLPRLFCNIRTAASLAAIFFYKQSHISLTGVLSQNTGLLPLTNLPIRQMPAEAAEPEKGLRFHCCS